MPVFLERFVLGVLVTVFVGVTLTNPMQFTILQRVLAVTIIVSTALLVGTIVEKKKPAAPPAGPPQHANPLDTEPRKDEPTAKPEQHHPAPTAPAPKRSPKPVLYWQGYMSHHAVTPDFFTVNTSEYPPSEAGEGTLSLYLQNDGNADLTRAKLYITYESGYEVIPDKPFDAISIAPEREVRGVSLEIPLIRPAPAEPFRFILKIKHITPTMMLYCKVDADQIPVGLEFTPLKVVRIGSRQ